MSEPKNLPENCSEILPAAQGAEASEAPPKPGANRQKKHPRISHLLALRFLSREERKILKELRNQSDLIRRTA